MLRQSRGYKEHLVVVELHVVRLGAIHGGAAGQEDGTHDILQILVPLVCNLEQRRQEVVKSDAPVTLSNAA